LNERLDDRRDDLFQLLGLLVQDGGARQDVLQQRQKAERRLGRGQVVGRIVGLATKVVAEIELRVIRNKMSEMELRLLRFLD